MKTRIFIDLFLVTIFSPFWTASLNYNIKFGSLFWSLHDLLMTALFHIAHLILDLSIQ